MTSSSIRHRLWRLVLLLLGALVLAGLLLLVLQRQGTTAVESLIAQRVVPLKQLKAVSDAYAVVVVDATHKVRDGALSFSQGERQVELGRIEARRQWAAYQAAPMSDRGRLLAGEVSLLLQRADDAAREAAGLMRYASADELQRFAASKLYPRVDPLSRAIDQLVEVQLEVAGQALAASQSRFNLLLGLSAAALLLVIGSSAWAAARLIDSVVTPLGRAVQVAEAVARGELEVAISFQGNDEIAQLLQAVDRMKASLIDLAQLDPLTQLLNRRSLERHAVQAMARARRTGELWSVLLIDLDRFKLVNDSYGHAAGDDVLREVASALPAMTRTMDHVARWGGEEFVMLLAGGDPGVAAQVGERVRRALQGLSVQSGPHSITLTASVGVAGANFADEDLAAVLGRADHALYMAKDRGRNRVVTLPVPLGEPEHGE